jgi:glycyl-tRNA synthetase beta subunit
LFTPIEFLYRDVTTALHDLHKVIELFFKEVMDISCSSESGMSKKKRFSTLKNINKTKMALFTGKRTLFFQLFGSTGSVEPL